MRTSADRIRHTVLFETIGLVICVPFSSWVLGKGLARIGALSIVLSLTAMCLNYIYNLVFDIVLVRLGRPVNVRPAWMRVFHTILFEVSLIILLIPIMAWWLDLTLWTAFLTDVGISLLFLVYTFVYNWVYDIVFPMPVEIEIEV